MCGYIPKITSRDVTAEAANESIDEAMHIRQMQLIIRCLHESMPCLNQVTSAAEIMISYEVFRLQEWMPSLSPCMNIVQVGFTHD